MNFATSCCKISDGGSLVEKNLINQDYRNFIEEIKNKIRSSQYEAMRAVNKTLISVYIGELDKRYIINNKKKDGENQLLNY